MLPMSTKANRPNIYNLTKIALCVALLCVSSYLVFPLPFTPIVISLHTIMVNLIGLVLKPKHVAVTILTYLLMGLIGLPVFSAGAAGPGKLFGPTGGFYFGFLFAGIAISFLKGKKNAFWRYLIATICVGLPIQHICAVLMMCLHNGFQVQVAFVTVSLPFIIGDIIKCIMACIVAVPLNNVLRTII